MVIIALVFGQNGKRSHFSTNLLPKSIEFNKKKSKKKFQNFSPTSTGQNFFTFLKIAVLSCFGAYCIIQYAWETVQLTCWS